MRGRERAALVDGLRGRIEPRRFGDKGEDDRERRRENKGSRDGTTKADRALVFRRSRRIPRWRTAIGNALPPAQGSGAPPVQAKFMNMSDREPKL